MANTGPKIEIPIVDLLTKRFEDLGNGQYFLGEAATGSLESDAVWRIQKILESGSILSVTFADGDGDFDNVWNDRAILTYN